MNVSVNRNMVTHPPSLNQKLRASEDPLAASGFALQNGSFRKSMCTHVDGQCIMDTMERFVRHTSARVAEDKRMISACQVFATLENQVPVSRYSTHFRMIVGWQQGALDVT